ncbi:MAG: hypothetical protein AAF628_04380 [Planctomycetota bacterium]
MTSSGEHARPDASAAVDAALGQDDQSLPGAGAEFVLEVAEARVLLEDFRALSTDPSGRVPVAMRYAVRRRNELRGRRGFEGSTWVMKAAQVAAVAAVVLAGLLSWQDGRRPRAAIQLGPLSAAAGGLPALEDRVSGLERVGSAGSAAPLGPPPPAERRGQGSPRGALANIDPFTRVVAADRDLAWLRLEFVQRFSRQARRRSIELCGGRPDLEDRIQALAAVVAGRLEFELDQGTATVAGVALGLRALLASGSSFRLGHRDTVGRANEHLRRGLNELSDAELATALAALTDVAVVAGGQAADLVREHAERLAVRVMAPPARRGHHGAPGLAPSGQLRSALLSFATPTGSLADAGRVFRLAPAFGVHPAVAERARQLVAAHLEERLAAQGDGRPDLLAAQLYGFADLVDRRDVGRKLRLWRPALLARDHYVALHHLAWSQLPPGPGWAKFQRELRELATLPTPRDLGDAAALLLGLSANFAAPGVRSVLGLAD